jgi:hypothetical protein
MEEYPTFDLSRTTLPEPYLIAIGRLSYLWGHLETVVEMAISKLSGINFDDPRSAIMITHMTWPLRMDVLGSLIEYLKPKYPYLAKFSNVQKLLKKAQDGRNKILHAKWGYQDGIVSISRISARGQLKMSITPVTITEIDGISNDIGQATTELLKRILNK